MTLGEGLTAVVGAVIAIGGGVMAWRKNASRDSVEISENSAREDFLQTVLKERDAEKLRADAADTRADAISDAFNKTARELALVNAERENEKRRSDKLHRALRRMAEGLEPELRQAWEQVLETDFAPLSGPETKP